MHSPRGISSYGTYLPYWRLTYATIAAALGTTARGSGARTVAGYDEDTTTLAVEAARRALVADGAEACDGVVLASSNPVYADKTNATTLHAALGMRDDVHAGDANGSVRSGVAALLGSIQRPGSTLVALADVRIGPSGSQDEMRGGDAAAAFVVGDGVRTPLVAELIGSSSMTREFLDRWRGPGDPWSATWEERFGEDVYTELGRRSLEEALAAADVEPAAVAHVAVVGLSARAATAVLRTSTIPKASALADMTGQIGDCGTAHPGLALAAMLDRAAPDELIVLTVLADGADTLVLRTTDAHRPGTGPTVAAQLTGPTGDLSYTDYLSWRGLLERQQPRRPDPDRAVAPASNRQLEWKFSFSCSVCDMCGVRHLPPQRVCMACAAVDAMHLERLADNRATIATYTIDHLAYSLAPPVIGAVLDFDGGGRFQCELTDIDVDSLAVGQRMELTFRHISDAAGIRNYFWKARPAHEEDLA